MCLSSKLWLVINGDDVSGSISIALFPSLLASWSGFRRGAAATHMNVLLGCASVETRTALPRAPGSGQPKAPVRA